MRALITGAGGFVGGWLTRHLEDEGDEVIGLDHDVDVTDGEAVRQAFRRARPEVVYHLAAASHVGTSWSAPLEVFRVNAEGTLNVVLAALDTSVERVLVVGSAEEYGRVRPEQLPIGEDTPLRPVSPYGASKVAAEAVTVQAALGRGLGAIAVRAFNHLGPGQSEQLVASTLAHQVASNERTGGDVVLAGNLTPRRDFTDVRDVVRAYRLLVASGAPGEVYNVCRGEDVAVAELAEQLIGLSDRPMRVETDPERLRPVDLPALRGDNAKLRQATGWAPEIPVERTLTDLLDWWRERVAEQQRQQSE